jgi:cell division cycle 20, cofactor of APC complex
MDWSPDNLVTVCLGNSVYLWNAGTGNFEVLLFDNENGESNCSLACIQEGHILAVGTSSGNVELWDYPQMKRLRVMDGLNSRAGSLAWNSYVVSSGSRNGTIVHHDVRHRDHKLTTLDNHTMEACGLKWSTDLKYLMASAGNDKIVEIWPSVTGGAGTQNTLLHTFTEYQAAVRALAWCPWQPNILATGDFLKNKRQFTKTKLSQKVYFYYY